MSKMKVYLVYEYDRCDSVNTNIQVYKNEEDAVKWCKEHGHRRSIEFGYQELDYIENASEEKVKEDE